MYRSKHYDSFLQPKVGKNSHFNPKNVNFIDLHKKKGEMTMGSFSLGHVGLTYKILAKTNDSSYVKQVSHSQYGLKMPNPHGLTQQKITEAYVA